ncbi:putative ankyrin repeat protein RF_0381 [Eupeodes corollae]|uniref:putative ankyrin repeat protein RF_0381 n=1 Tax=Eupeodes corollae TaxID=290404 RepID=UPI002491536D|nr:putative ankyrin repeat protein RF_0381 [Eupeodes corollae]
MDVNDSLFQAVLEGNVNLAKEIITTYGLSYSKTWSMGYALLCISTKNRLTEITKLLLTSGAKVNDPDGNNKRRKFLDTPLHFAALNGHLEIVEMLLDKGANIHAKNQYGATPLQASIFRNKLDVVELLLKRGGAPLNEKKSNGITCLHRAVQKGSLRAVEMLLKYKVNVNAVTRTYRRDGQTPLHFAAEKGNDRIVQLLLKNGADVEAKAKGLTPVYFAALNRKAKVVKQLLEHGANVDAQDTMGKTILLLAVELGSLKMVEHILNHGPDLNNKWNCIALTRAIFGAREQYKCIVEKLLEYGFTYEPDYKLLQEATEKGYTKIVENCLNNLSNAESFLTNPTKTTTLLHSAVQKKQYAITEMLIKFGANVNCVDEKDKTPMYYATGNGDIKMVKLLLAKEAAVTNCPGLLINAVKQENIEMIHLLLKHKVDVKEADSYGRTALHYSALNEVNECLDTILCMELMGKIMKVGKMQSPNEKVRIAKILIDAGADVNAKSKDGRTALHYASYNAYHNVVKLLFEHNAKMVADNEGMLPLHLNAYNGNVDILKMLISKGADVNARTKYGTTAVHFATEEIKIEFLEYLFQHGAKIDQKEDDNGETALHAAARIDCLDLFELLLNYGADIDCTNNRGKTAFNIASQGGNHRIVKALLEYGCVMKNQSKKSFTPFESAMMLDNALYKDLFNHFGSDDDEDEYYGSDYDYFDCDSDYNAYYESENDDYDSDIDYSDYGNSIFSNTQITETNEIIQHHVIMMKAANLEVKDENIETKGTSSKLSEFKSKCEEEVEKLKCEKICAHTNVTFYDILSKPIYNVAIYLKNPQIVEALKKVDIKNQFPLYYGLINGKTKRANIRKDLLDEGYVFFDLLSDSLRLPYNCIENICSYLGDKDLRILAEASKSNGQQ